MYYMMKIMTNDLPLCCIAHNWRMDISWLSQLLYSINVNMYVLYWEIGIKSPQIPVLWGILLGMYVTWRFGSKRSGLKRNLDVMQPVLVRLKSLQKEFSCPETLLSFYKKIRRCTTVDIIRKVKHRPLRIVLR